MSDPNGLQEGERWRLYEVEKRAWTEQHQESTTQQYEAAMRQIIRRLGL